MGEYQYVTTGECCSRQTYPVAPRAEDVKIKCRTFGATIVPDATEEGATFPLVNLNVDTQGYTTPCIKLEFYTNILTDTATGTLNFQVFRQCKGQLAPVPVSGIWTFARAVATADEANSFGFALCDCDDCDCGCCNYSVVATVAGEATTGTITINNATLIATITEGAHC